MSKKLVVCFDGTWNKPDKKNRENDSNTNVKRIFDSINGSNAEGYSDGVLPSSTLKWYDTGVGTAWYEHIRGGAFGYGLSVNIRQGYKFLIDYYEPGDEIFIFGFSRGAYTARSLVGLIRNSGLLDRNRIMIREKGKNEKYPHWKRPTPAKFCKLSPDDIPHILVAYQLYRNRDGSCDTDYAVSFRQRYAHSGVKIRFLGVWDTVGALGIPFKLFEGFNAEHYKFHDQELSSIVEHAYHAIAIDEHRINYDVTLWNPKQKVNQIMEQVWFVGAHADVGGGYAYAKHPLSDVTLAWMQDKAIHCGLKIDNPIQKGQLDFTGIQPTDSFKEFLGGTYRWISDRHYRQIRQTTHGNEKIYDICGMIHGYAPKNSGYKTPLDE